MATWVTHLMVADNVLKKNPFLCRHEFCVGKQPELKKAAADMEETWDFPKRNMFSL